MYPRLLHFVHTTGFDASAAALPLGDDELGELQRVLCMDPRRGDVIPGTGGVRKIRLVAKSRGKRGGARVIYYFVSRAHTIYLLLAYAKSEADDLSAEGKRLMRRFVLAIEEAHG